ncbi:MAG: hypothetical protein U0R80_13135 [Nocardioidaceae bacterium]
MDAPLIVELSALRKAAVLSDEASAFYPSSAWHTRSVTSQTSSHEARAVRAVVETFKVPRGHTPRALLGAKFRPGPGGEVTAEVGSSRDPWNAPKNCTSRLWMHPFRAGLPEDYVRAVLEGLADPLLPPGVVTVDRAGHDDANSSPEAFGEAARLLALVLRTLMADGHVEAVVRDAMGSWA